MITELIEKYCNGNGLEIGSGGAGYCPRSRTKYVDKLVNGDKGPDIVSDACMIPLEGESVNFIFSSHCLEHIPNPLKALKEWDRILKHGGVLCLILPHHEKLIDSCRQVTTLDHVIEDFNREEGEVDPSHFSEMQEGWVKNGVISADEVWDSDFRVKNSLLHYHVWTQTEIVDILRYISYKILYVCENLSEREGSFVVIGEKK
jgi:SAM-dependent methyltransferase